MTGIINMSSSPCSVCALHLSVQKDPTRVLERRVETLERDSNMFQVTTQTVLQYVTASMTHSNDTRAR